MAALPVVSAVLAGIALVMDRELVVSRRTKKKTMAVETRKRITYRDLDARHGQSLNNLDFPSLLTSTTMAPSIHEAARNSAHINRLIVLLGAYRWGVKNSSQKFDHS